MILIRKAAERGHFDHGWLNTWHTFSFADYYDPEFMGFRSLRVINEDRVAPGAGFPPHSHRDMEIVTCVLEGAITHRDSMGHEAVLRPGEVQRMTAGGGVTHSEYNTSKTEPLHLLQIWIVPETRGLKPEYEQKAFSEDERRDRLRLVVSKDAREGSLRIHQDVSVYTALVGSEKRIGYDLGSGRAAWVQVARGRIALDDVELSAGDGAAVTDERSIVVVGQSDAEILLFDLA